MNNYTTLIGELKREIVNFSKKVCKGKSKPVLKFVTDMFYGMLECQNVHLSNIARALKEKITLKKVIERLSRNLAELNEGQEIFDNYVNNIKKEEKETGILVIDETEVAKPQSVSLEDMCEIRDGSTKEITQGYFIIEMVALAKSHKMPIPVYSKLYSSKEKEFVSSDNEIIEGLKYLSKNFSKGNVRVLDRGFDAKIYYEYFLENEENFVIRAKKNRNVIYKGESKNIMEVAKKYKGKYKLPFRMKDGRRIDLKISMIPVSLCSNKEKELKLVVVYGFWKEPMILLSNIKTTTEKIGEVIGKVYLMRWRIEEYFKFKKQQFKFEDLRVRKLKSIKNLNTLLTMVIGMLGLLSEKQNVNKMVIEIIKISKRIYGKRKFIYYAIADGIFEILHRGMQGIRNLFVSKSYGLSGQLCLNLEMVS